MNRDEIRTKVRAFALERIRVYNHHSKTRPMVPAGTIYAKLRPNPRTYVLPQGGLLFPWVRKSDG